MQVRLLLKLEFKIMQIIWNCIFLNFFLVCFCLQLLGLWGLLPHTGLPSAEPSVRPNEQVVCRCRHWPDLSYGNSHVDALLLLKVPSDQANAAQDDFSAAVMPCVWSEVKQQVVLFLTKNHPEPLQDGRQLLVLWRSQRNSEWSSGLWHGKNALQYRQT